MHYISNINQHIPIWAVIKGDHACTDADSFLNPQLLAHPNFANKKENSLRETYLKETTGRRWLYDFLYQKSFSLVEITRKDFETVATVFDGAPLLDFAKEYKRAKALKQGFKFQSLNKTYEDVCYVEKMKNQEIITPTDPNWLEQFTRTNDFHRSLWMKKGKKFTLVDGTHRMLAMTWKYVLNKKKMPTLYGIAFEG